MQVQVMGDAELLTVSGYNMGGGLVDHGEHTPRSRSHNQLDDEEDEEE